jgi:hypothetical protein
MSSSLTLIPLPVVVNLAFGAHQPSTVALISGLAERKAKTGKEAYFVQASIPSLPLY